MAAKAKAVLPSHVIVRGHGVIADRFDRFNAELPALAAALALKAEEITSFG